MCVSVVNVCLNTRLIHVVNSGSCFRMKSRNQLSKTLTETALTNTTSLARTRRNMPSTSATKATTTTTLIKEKGRASVTTPSTPNCDSLQQSKLYKYSIVTTHARPPFPGTCFPTGVHSVVRGTFRHLSSCNSENQLIS